MAVLDTGDVAPEQSSPLLNVALRELLCLAQYLQTLANDIMTLRTLEGDYLPSWLIYQPNLQVFHSQVLLTVLPYFVT